MAKAAAAGGAIAAGLAKGKLVQSSNIICTARTQTTLDKIKAIADDIGFASDMKAYKQNPDAYKGNVGDVSMFIRIAVSGKTVSPDMYEVMRVLGKAKVLERLNDQINTL